MQNGVVHESSEARASEQIGEEMQGETGNQIEGEYTAENKSEVDKENKSNEKSIVKSKEKPDISEEMMTSDDGFAEKPEEKSEQKPEEKSEQKPEMSKKSMAKSEEMEEKSEKSKIKSEERFEKTEEKPVKILGDAVLDSEDDGDEDSKEETVSVMVHASEEGQAQTSGHIELESTGEKEETVQAGENQEEGRQAREYTRKQSSGNKVSMEATQEDTFKTEITHSEHVHEERDDMVQTKANIPKKESTGSKVVRMQDTRTDEIGDKRNGEGVDKIGDERKGEGMDKNIRDERKGEGVEEKIGDAVVDLAVEAVRETVVETIQESREGERFEVVGEAQVQLQQNKEFNDKDENNSLDQNVENKEENATVDLTQSNKNNNEEDDKATSACSVTDTTSRKESVSSLPKTTVTSDTKPGETEDAESNKATGSTNIYFYRYLLILGQSLAIPIYFSMHNSTLHFI